nr:DUF2752 domain-containing protein [Bacteroidota bacterium]
MKKKALSTDQRIVRSALAVVLLVILVLSYVFEPSTYHLIDCAFLNLTGLPCPSCGMTRSFHAMAHLQVHESFVLNWMGPIIFVGMLLMAILFFTETTTGITIQFQRKVPIIMVSFIGLAGMWLVLWIVRLLMKI